MSNLLKLCDLTSNICIGICIQKKINASVAASLVDLAILTYMVILFYFAVVNKYLIKFCYDILQTHPYCLVFFKNVTFEFRFYDYMVTLIFILDLIVHLSTGANVEEG